MDLRVVLIGGLGFAVLCILCAMVYAPRIENDLTSRSKAALAAAGVVFDAVQFDGRDGLVTLSGGGTPRSHRSVNVVGAVPGVRVARVTVVDPEWKPPPPPERNAWLRLTVSDEYAELVGSLPAGADLDGLRDTISRSLGGTFVREAVDDETGDAEAPWLDAYLAAVHSARGGTMELSFEVRGDQAQLRGVVPDEPTRAAVLRAVVGGLSDLELDAQLVVRPEPASAESSRRKRP